MISESSPHSRWLRATEWPLTVAALLFLAVYSWAVIADLQGVAANTAEAVMLAIWVVFAVDYAVQFAVARPRTRWFFSHLPQLAMVVLPILRPLRLLRLFTLWTALQRTTGSRLRGRITIFVVGSAGLLVYIAALSILEVERHAPDATITTLGDALWWAVVTVTTVGYGDLAPVTEVGRMVAIAVMLAGIALLGVVTATLASWLVEQVTAEEHTPTPEISELLDEVRKLRAALAHPLPSKDDPDHAATHHVVSSG